VSVPEVGEPNSVKRHRKALYDAGFSDFKLAEEHAVNVIGLTLHEWEYEAGYSRLSTWWGDQISEWESP